MLNVARNNSAVKGALDMCIEFLFLITAPRKLKAAFSWPSRGKYMEAGGKETISLRSVVNFTCFEFSSLVRAFSSLVCYKLWKKTYLGR